MTPPELAAEATAWSDLQVAHDDDSLVAAASAVTAFVSTLPAVRNAAGGVWPADVRLGAVILTARLFRRRDTPTGVLGFADDGSPSYVARYDADVSRLLHLDDPVIG